MFNFARAATAMACSTSRRMPMTFQHTARELHAGGLLRSATIGKAAGQANDDGSVYENYHEAAQVYDGIRHAGGVEVILGAWATGSTPLHKQHVLDIGCGTGNYAAAVAPHVGKLTCMDGNASMLAKCEEKLTGLCDTPVTFQQNLLPSLAMFDDNSFDSAMCNLVIHHIENDASRPTWANYTALVAEASRVLKPGGTLCFNHITPEQVDTYWFLRYVPECLERWRSTLVPGEQMSRIMRVAGFSEVSRTTPMDYVLFRPDAYLDPRGPLDTEWRKSTSMWAVGESDELAVALRRIADDNDSGAIHGVLAECEARRKEIGHTCFYYGRVPE